MDFLIDKISRYLEELKKYRFSYREPIIGWKIKDCGYKPSGNALPEVDSSWRDFGKGCRWGTGPDSHCWFFRRVTVPEETGEGEALFYFNVVPFETHVDSNPQFTVYVNGRIAHGLDHNHRFIRLPGSGDYDIFVYAYTGVWSGEHGLVSELMVKDDDVEKLYYDLLVPRDCLRVMREGSAEYYAVLRRIDEAMALVDFTVPGSEEFHASVRRAGEFLDERFYGEMCGGPSAGCVCIGHTHIDVAWLWTLAQTREKAVRSFSNVVDMMETCPEYKFMSSQPQLYKFVKEDSPETYEKIKALVKAGRWEPEGAMWVEADCNLTSGESLVRQILFGKRFFREEFGVESRVLWLPDVFGYSAALPQILAKSGIDKFVTSKISWNEYNTMPYDSFIWRGIDDTGVFTWFLTAQDLPEPGKWRNTTTYNADITPSAVKGCWERYQQKYINDEVILTFGEGDGGGGPKQEQIEYHRRLSHGVPTFPKTKIEFAGDFLERAKNRALADPKTPVWHGELYLEYHRGTYTSNALNKRNNRKCELLYQNTELFCETDRLLNGAEYPAEKINEGWECILLNQFHDIIPGSSIAPVYAQSTEQYEKIKADARLMLDRALDGIADGIGTDGGLLVYNPLSFTHSGAVEANGKKAWVENVPAKGWAVVGEPDFTCSVTVTEKSIENDFYRIEFADDYTMSRIYDKRAGREVLSPGGRGNVIEVYEDLPREYDAWELSRYYREKMREMDDVSAVEIVDEGAAKGIKITRRFCSSTFVQTIRLWGRDDRIDFETFVDWKEQHLVLKAAFPVEINADRATYEIQFGTIERPTHSNTSWDRAKFEVCAHKFADLSECGYGVSILNDCKYGHDIHDGVIRLTLLKCPTHPSPVADKCRHDFTYSLCPHEGGFEQAGIVEKAYDLNDPMIARPISARSGRLPESFSLVSVSEKNVVVDTVKKAEDCGTTVMRLYESCNRRCEAKLTLGFDYSRAALCDLMENELEPLEIRDGVITLPVKPFEIITVKLFP